MKRYLVVILLAILTGSLLGYYTFRGLKASAKANKQVYLFQLGVYTSKDNAIKKSKKIDNTIIIKEGDYFHVYSNVFTNLELVNKVKKYYDENNIHYYVKNVDVDNKSFDEIQEYEKVLKEVSDVEVINKTSIKMLQIYENYRGLDEIQD